MKKINILLLGSGGRESAFAWKLKQSHQCGQLYIAPGNAGTAQSGINISIPETDFEAIERFCREQKIDLVIPGGENALVSGIYDHFHQAGKSSSIFIAGPSQSGATLEGSKSFAKQFMYRHGIPTAAYREFTASNFDEGKNYIRNHRLPIVLKADGLAAGKGVVISQTHEEALQNFHAMIREARFGTAGEKVVIEEFLSGIELSVFILTDGRHYLLLPEAKDYKKIGEGDTGLNTGGMGAISPIPFLEKDFMEKVTTRIIEPTLSGLQTEKIAYSGFLFFGLMNVAGDPFVIEYNCRMGDPETEVVLPRLQNDLITLLIAACEGTLNDHKIRTQDEQAASVMLVSKGYPEAYEKGKKISGLEHVSGSLVFHAGTLTGADDQIYTNGGRVLAITSLGNSLNDALSISYKNAEKIDFEGKYYRKDIGFEFS